ncbi:hypothetical protein [Rubellicoccus peritrichatus]|uniref:F5/8 type C domain-containing protein n=1 Tax=Rubellicoccus peritrichatus TaxID=3080537 RepID=A0AAQ3L716_9BACT|nr:hypothetical protein [Puniceicoccus sp. CR14]WOO40191.1 hypothetical protein RZN69_16340 [Puniceicoccus sp. CR14]
MKYTEYLTTFAAVTLSLSFVGCGGDSKSEAPAADASQPATSQSAPASSSGSGTMVLKTEIPPEQIEGTPMPVKIPNLEAAPGTTPTINVPEGTVLLSKGKPVTGSDDFPIVGELAYITDGDKLAGEGYFVELMDGLQWVQIDLGQPSTIYAIWLWHYHSQRRAYNDVIVQISNDAEFKSDVTTLFNNDYDNSGGMGQGSDKPYVESRYGKLISVDGVKGQYVRLYSAGNTSNDMNHYIEVEVFGKP